MPAKTPVTDELIDGMVKALVDEVNPEQVILFGSRARGEEREDSDIDLIVVETEPFGPDRSRHKELSRLYRTGRVSRRRRGVGLFPGGCGLLAGLAQPRPGAGPARREGSL